MAVADILKATTTRQRISAAALTVCAALVVHFEGVVPNVYRDPIGIKTACVGHVDKTLQMGQTFTQEQCQKLLAADLTTAANGVASCAHEHLSDNEYAAYVSFAFNEGVANFCASTLLRLLNKGDHAGACAQLTRWDKAGKETVTDPDGTRHEEDRILPGLVTRRAAERRLCES